MFRTYKRWMLKEDCQEGDVVALVREAIIPAYRQLPGCLGLELLRIEGTRSYLANQHWESRTAYDAAISAKSRVNLTKSRQVVPLASPDGIAKD